MTPPKFAVDEWVIVHPAASSSEGVKSDWEGARGKIISYTPAFHKLYEVQSGNRIYPFYARELEKSE